MNRREIISATVEAVAQLCDLSAENSEAAGDDIGRKIAGLARVVARQIREGEPVVALLVERNLGPALYDIEAEGRRHG